MHFFIAFLYTYSLGNKKLHGIDFWTSGTDQGCKGINHWCSIYKNIINRNMSWSGVENGDCITTKFTNRSQYSKTQCSNSLNYICEVIETLDLEFFCYFCSIIRFVKRARTHREFKMSVWKFGIFQLVGHFLIRVYDFINYYVDFYNSWNDDIW